MTMTRKKINEAIKHTGLEVAGKAGDGCYYFVDVETNAAIMDAEPLWIGSMSHFKRSRWISEAETAAKIRDEAAYLACDLPTVIILV